MSRFASPVYVFTSVLLVRRFAIHELVWMFLVVCVVSIGADIAADVAAGTFRPWTSEFRLGRPHFIQITSAGWARLSP